MTVKAAMELKRGDHVALTHDSRIWTVVSASKGSYGGTVKVQSPGGERMVLNGTEALKSLKSLKRKTSDGIEG